MKKEGNRDKMQTSVILCFSFFSTVISFTSSGSAFGTMIASSLSGYLSKHGFAGGWPSVFYVSGILCITIGIIYLFLVANDPKDHPFVPQREYKYIVDHVPALRAERDRQLGLTKSDKCEQKRSVPWLGILTSGAVIAEICVKIASMWSYSLVILKAPAYMEKVLSMPLDQNGYFTSAIFLSYGLSHFVGGMAADTIINRKVFRSKTPVRKIFQGMCTFGTAFFLALIPFAGCNQMLFLVILIASQATFGMVAGGELPLPSDMSNEYAATLFSISNTFGMSTGVVGPYLTGLVLDAAPSMPARQWSYIIYFTAAFNCLGGLIFSLTASAESQTFGQSAINDCGDKSLSTTTKITI